MHDHNLENQIEFHNVWHQLKRLTLCAFPFIAIVLLLLLLLLSVALVRLIRILNRPKPKASARPRWQAESKGHGVSQKNRSSEHGAHLLVVLGSGGHTAEMLSILANLGVGLLERFERRTYVVSSGDGFSAERAAKFEAELLEKAMILQEDAPEGSKEKQHKLNGVVHKDNTRMSDVDGAVYGSYSIATVHRARKIHQPLYTTPFSALWCLWDCITLLRGIHGELEFQASSSHTSGTRKVKHDLVYSYPDLILTNGPGTGVCVVLAALILLIGGFGNKKGKGEMRTIYIESWARVKTLSLSGRILKYLVDRFLVQWEKLAEIEGGGQYLRAEKPKEESNIGRVDYIGPLVS